MDSTDAVLNQTWIIEHFHVTSQSRENHTGGHFGVQLRLSMLHDAHAKCSPNLTVDGLTSHVQYRYPVHVVCET